MIFFLKILRITTEFSIYKLHFKVASLSPAKETCVFVSHNCTLCFFGWGYPCSSLLSGFLLSEQVTELCNPSLGQAAQHCPSVSPRAGITTCFMKCLETSSENLIGSNEVVFFFFVIFFFFVSSSCNLINMWDDSCKIKYIHIYIKWCCYHYFKSFQENKQCILLLEW